MDELKCFFCWDDKKKKEKERYYFDDANNMRVCIYCPNCGRKYGEVPTDEQLDARSNAKQQYQYDEWSNVV